jgi:hypothetical protein
MLFRGLTVRAAGVCLAALLPCAPALHVSAQTAPQSSLKVTVVDPNGDSVARARVSVQTGETPPRTSETNDRGEASFSRLGAGPITVTVVAEGFTPHGPEGLVLAPGANQTRVALAVAEIQEDVSVEPDARERNLDPRGPAFSNVLTEEQLAQLPDDPEEFENAINQLAGPGANIRVNGFRGGRLPPKSQIREIRFRRNAFAAENHERGFVMVDIFTKPGIGEWRGTVGFGFRDESLNARQPFARFRGPEQLRRLNFSLDGPLWKNRTSAFFSADVNSAYDARTVVAALPAGRFEDLVFRPSNRQNFSARVEHAFDKVHALRAEYQRNTVRQENLGVGDQDLPERAYDFEQREHLFRLSESGTFAGKFLNELRFQARWQERETRPLSDAPAVLVSGAFNSGGALTRGTRSSRDFELADNVDFATEKHSMRFGVQLEAARYRSDESSNAFGSFTFASLDAYNARTPTTYSQRFGDPALSFTQYQFAWYWQDDWRVRKDLMLSYGVRHETQTNLSDGDNFAPRVGLAWTPTKSGNVTVRAGAGVFYDWLESGTYEQALRVDGRRQREVVVPEPDFTDPLGGDGGVQLPASRIEIDPELRMPTILAASVGVETRLTPRLRLMTDYRFERGLHLLRGRNVNAPVNGVRPRPDFGNVTRVESSATSTSHRFSAHLMPGMIRSGFFWSVMYAYSRTLTDTAGALSLPADNNDLRGEWGPAPNDLRHFFSGMLNRQLFKGLSAGVMFSANSAPPYNVTTGFDDNLDTVSNDRPAGVSRNSARGAARWELGTRLSWSYSFGPERKASAGPMQMVVRVRDDGGGGGPQLPGASNKRFRLDLYAQAFNVLNHTNLTGFNGVLSSPFYGRATASLPGRRIETGLRFSF